jgi:hypothetical protein
MESTQYHTVAITVRTDIKNGQKSKAKRRNTMVLDKIAEELPELYTMGTVDLRVEPHHYIDIHEECD